MQVLNSYYESNLRPQLDTNHEMKTSPLQNINTQNTEAERVSTGKSNEELNQETTRGSKGNTISNQNAEISADNNNKKFSQGNNISSNSVSQEKTKVEKQPEKKKAASNNDNTNNHNNDFTFAYSHPDSPVAADKLFHNGQIRPAYQADNIDNVDKKKMSVEERDDRLVVNEPAGPYCMWSPGQGKKAGSTGNSRRRKLKNLVMRSKSEGVRKKAG